MHRYWLLGVHIPPPLCHSLAVYVAIPVCRAAPVRAVLSCLRYVGGSPKFAGEPRAACARGQPPCCDCMFFVITSSVSLRATVGLNCTISESGSLPTPAWPGGR